MKKKTIICGAIGLLVAVLSLVSGGFFKIPAVIYGLLTGVICRGFIPKTTEKTILKNTCIVFLVTLLLGIVIRIIVMIGSFLILNPNAGANITIRYTGTFIHRMFLSGLLLGLVVGIICSASVFVFLKSSQKKGRLPFVEIDKNKILAE